MHMPFSTAAASAQHKEKIAQDQKLGAAAP
jgi:hypothetical protein